MRAWPGPLSTFSKFRKQMERWAAPADLDEMGPEALMQVYAELVEQMKQVKELIVQERKVKLPARQTSWEEEIKLLIRLQRRNPKVFFTDKTTGPDRATASQPATSRWRSPRAAHDRPPL